MQKQLALLAVLAFACDTSCNRSTNTARSVPPEAPPDPAVAVVQQGSTGRSPLGTNLTEFSDWSPQFATIDAFKQSRSWISGTRDQWEDTQPLDLDEHGWVRRLLPGQVARTVLFWGGAVDYPAGRYAVRYRGQGSLEYFNDGEVVSRRPGRDELRVDGKRGGIAVLLTATDPKDPIRDIRIIPPGKGCDQDERRACQVDEECAPGHCVPLQDLATTRRFHPRFLETLAPYGVLRFMDWMKTNDSKLERWEDRPLTEDARWTEKGVPVEVLVQLVNVLDADAWVNVPHRADDGFVRELASLLAKTVEPERTVFVEYSNEVWNGAFGQANYARERGVAEGLGGDSPFEAQMRYYARRSVEIFRIFSEAFRDRGRLVRVMASQAANPDVSRMILSFRDAHRETDVLAIAPYFGGYLGEPGELHRVAALSQDALMSELRGEALRRARTAMEGQAEVAKRFDVGLIAYEGGQHLVGVGPATEHPGINALFDEANRDPRMAEVYARHLEDWKQSGGKLFVHYAHCDGVSKWGRWGALESLLAPVDRAPKHRALVAFARTQPRWWSSLERPLLER
jgi:hypothetical protein